MGVVNRNHAVDVIFHFINTHVMYIVTTSLNINVYVVCTGKIKHEMKYDFTIEDATFIFTVPNSHERANLAGGK